MRAMVAVIAGGFLATAGLLMAQSGPTGAASDNPLAGLDVNGTTSAPDAPANDDRASTATLFGKFKGHLVVVDKGQFVPADPALLDGTKYVIFYYAAGWSTPCRAFAPKLVDFYNRFLPQHPTFQLIFVDEDKNADDMLNYMVAAHMTCPAVSFEDIDSHRLKPHQFAGPHIPCLVLVNDQGSVLADSFSRNEQTGLERVMYTATQMVLSNVGGQ